jgi:hypothetical protein
MSKKKFFPEIIEVKQHLLGRLVRTFFNGKMILLIFFKLIEKRA